MIKQFITLTFLISIFSTTSCDLRADLENQPRSNFKFSDLPDTLKTLYIESSETKYPDNFPKLTNLDKNVISRYSYSSSKIVSSWYGEQVFTFNNKEVVLSWNGNEINEPYILYNKELYFVISRNCFDKESFEKAEFGKYDLAKLIKVN